MATAGFKISTNITLSGLTDPHVYGFALHFVRRGSTTGPNASPNITTFDEMKSSFTVQLDKPSTPPKPQNSLDKTSWTQTGNQFQLTFPGTEGGETGDYVALQPGTYMLAAVRVDLNIPAYLYAGIDFNADATTVNVPKFYPNQTLHLGSITVTQQGWAIP